MTGLIIVAERIDDEHIADESTAELLPSRYAIFSALGGTGYTINAPRSKWWYRVVREVEVKHPLDTYFKICERLGIVDGSRHPSLAELLAVFDFDFVVADAVEARHPARCCVVS